MALFPASLSPFGELLDHLPWHPATRRFAAARADLDAVIYRLIEQRRRDPRDRGDLLSILLSSCDEDGRPMPTELVRDEALTLLLAGHETTANALAWTWDALSRNTAAEARLHAELDDVLGDRDPVPGDYPRLTFTRDVVAESMRLRPPAWILGRRVIRPIRLGEWDVPAGSVLLTSQLVTHLQPALLAGARGVPARALVERRDREPAALRLLSVRRRQPRVHRRELRLDRGRARPGDPGPPGALGRARPVPVPLDPLVTLRPGRSIAMRVETRRSHVSV